jgi:hypothetical protein
MAAMAKKRRGNGAKTPLVEAGRATQFQPGNPGGPGRPATATFSEIARELLKETDPKKRKTKARLLVERAYAKAARGSARHLEILLDRVEGKVKQVAELTGPNGGALRFENMTEVQLDTRLKELMAKYEAGKKKP